MNDLTSSQLIRSLRQSINASRLWSAFQVLGVAGIGGRLSCGMSSSDAVSGGRIRPCQELWYEHFRNRDGDEGRHEHNRTQNQTRKSPPRNPARSDFAILHPPRASAQAATLTYAGSQTGRSSSGNCSSSSSIESDSLRCEARTFLHTPAASREAPVRKREPGPVLRTLVDCGIRLRSAALDSGSLP